MRIAFLTEKNNAFRSALCEVLQDHGHDVDIYNGEFLETTCLESYDLVILKTKKPKFLGAAYRAKSHGVRVIPDPLTAETIRNRVLCDKLMNRASILCPVSLYGKTSKIRQEAPPDFWPAVKKPLMSSGGRGIELVENASALEGDADDEPVYLQKLVSGKHFLIYFIGKNVYAFEKQTNLGPEIEAPIQVPVWDALIDTVESFKKATGILWGDLDIVVSEEQEIYNVDPGSFPSFKYIPKHPKEVADEIVSNILG